MPDCPISAPPPLFALPSPSEMPINWLGFCLLLGLMLYFGAGLYLNYLRYVTPLVRRRRAVVLALAGWGCLIAGLIFFLLLLPSSTDRISSWESVQTARFIGQNCSLDALFNTHVRLDSILDKWLWGALITEFVAGVFIIPIVRLRYVRANAGIAQAHDV